MKKLRRVFPYLLICLGILLLLYPIYSTIVVSQITKENYDNYLASVAQMNDAQKEEAYQKADLYNQSLLANALIDPFSSVSENNQTQTDYLGAFSVTSEGMIGELSIPKISLDLSVFHGTTDEVLSKGAGHLIGSSLPSQQSGTHVVLTGHSGLQGAKLFTDIRKLEVGDLIYFTVLNEKRAYKVDNILVVEPTDTSWFQILPDEDRLTLFTCTPLGINSERLLVSAVRTEDEGEAVTPSIDWYTIGILALVLFCILMMLWMFLKKRKQKKAAKPDDYDQKN